MNWMRGALMLALGSGLSGAIGCDADRAGGGAGGSPGQAAEAVPAARSGGGPGLSATPEATSLTGQPLYRLELDPAAEARMLVQLDSAESAYAADPDDADALVWLGRRLAYLGRYRDAIEVFTEGIERHKDDPRMYRHRGHRFISVRELDRAIEDLEHAARLISGQEDVVEPDGQPNAAGIPRSTLQTNIWYHLGLARYLNGEFDRAIHAFERGFELSGNDDMRVAMADWLWMALRRLGRDAEAAELLEFVEPEMDILENDAYHRRLLLYRGELGPGSLMAPGRDGAADPLQLATYGYGLGHWHLLQGDTARARQTFGDVIGTGYWPAFGYIAAEAELKRLGP